MLARLASRLTLAQALSDQPFELCNELGRSERPPDPFGGAQRRKAHTVALRLDEIGKAADAVEQRGDTHERIIAAGNVRTRARPRPILGTFDEPRTYWIERDVAGRRHQVRVVERDRRE